MPSFVTPAEVRSFLVTSQTTGNFSDANLNAAIDAASSLLQRETGRQFEAQTGVTKTVTTFGRRSRLTIPDIRTATTVTLRGTVLVSNTDYILEENEPGSGVYTYLTFSTESAALVGTGNFPLRRDLVILGDWGWSTLPAELTLATKVLAGWYTKRPDSLLANVAVTPEGAVLNYRSLPPEVTDFIESWRVESWSYL